MISVHIFGNGRKSLSKILRTSVSSIPKSGNYQKTVVIIYEETAEELF